ncbi:hypothetical protein SORBI_3003G085566 [Sorghum bicolor]|uniref:Uncharacterized protein n=1 Tax=Sorghum bicolor TaxID=4558 RepID=A0A1W0VW92_SORBI|nr:hypothetical protein SORBI_3003G085566 [Sorghum bicolor]
MAVELHSVWLRHESVRRLLTPLCCACQLSDFGTEISVTRMDRSSSFLEVYIISLERGDGFRFSTQRDACRI